MYEAFFGLKQKPFNMTPDPEFLFFTEKHREAFAHLVYGINERRGFIQITGEVGAGKTTLCRALFNEFDEHTKIALVLNPFLSDIELLRTINEEFFIDSSGATRKELIDTLSQFLIEQHARGVNVVLVIDEAQNIPDNTLEQIRIISNLETVKDKLLQIVLVGQPELREKLASKRMRQINQRISVRYHLGAMSAKESAQYIQHRLRVAGAGENKPYFTKDALELVHKIARGIPRRINAVCDQALLVGYVTESTTIDKSVVQRARKELVGMRSMKQTLAEREGVLRAAWVLAGVVVVGVIAFAVWTQLGGSSAPPAQDNVAGEGAVLPAGQLQQNQLASAPTATATALPPTATATRVPPTATGTTPPTMTWTPAPVDEAVPAAAQAAAEEAGEEAGEEVVEEVVEEETETTARFAQRVPTPREVQPETSGDDVTQVQRPGGRFWQADVPDSNMPREVDGFTSERPPDNLPEGANPDMLTQQGGLAGAGSTAAPTPGPGEIQIGRGTPASDEKVLIVKTLPEEGQGTTVAAGERVQPQAEPTRPPQVRRSQPGEIVLGQTGRFDRNGVLRCEHNAMTLPAAMATALGQHNINRGLLETAFQAGSTDEVTEQLVRMADRAGLAMTRVWLTTAKLRRLQLPAVLELAGETGGRHYVTAWTENGSMQLGDPLQGLRDYHADWLDRRWYGRAIVFCPSRVLSAQPLGLGVVSAEVQKLQQELKRLGRYSGPTDGRFSRQVKDVIEDFQRENFIKVDGIVGKETQLFLYAALKHASP